MDNFNFNWITAPMKSLIPYLIIAALAILCIWLYETKQDQIHRANRAESVIQEKEAKIAYLETENGKIASQKDAALVTAKEFREAYSQFARDVQDMRVELRTLKAAVQAGFTASGEGESIIVHDTIVAPSGLKMLNRNLAINDGYLTFKASWDTVTWKAKYDYAYTDTVTLAISGKKRWLFGNENLTGTVSFKNPKSIATSQTALLFGAKRDKRWTVGPGIYYDPLRGNYGIAITAGYALIKF